MLRVLLESFPSYVDDDIYNHLTEYKGTLLYSRTGSKTDEVEAGYINCHVADVKGAIANGWRASQVYDLFHETGEFYKHLYTSECRVNREAHYLPKTFKANSNVLILNSLTIDKVHAGRRFGLALMRRTIQQLGMGCDMAVLFAHPIVDIADVKKDHSHAQERLVDYYSSFGFVEVEKRSGVMAYDLSEGLLTLEELGVTDM
jgi:hypothetical protein